jgi:NAD+ kinase
MNKILVVPNINLDGALDCALRVQSILKAHQIEVLMPSETIRALGIVLDTACETNDLFNQCDMVIAIGGDGTIFHCAYDAMKANKPILGINSGHLGFLSQMESSDLQPLENLFTGDFQIEHRMVLRVNIHTKNQQFLHYAINDVVLSRYHLGRIIDLEVYCDDHFVSLYRADGLIFSTPTGSTAYSLSAGGPIIDPLVQSIVMTPICPHSLYNRSIVFGSDKLLTAKLKPKNSQDRLSVSIDGLGTKYHVIESVVVDQSPYKSQFVCLGHRNFYQTINEKLKYRG